jgi:hypothetical protein
MRSTHSAAVTLRFIVGDASFELGQVGPEMLIFQQDCELPPCDGEVVMTIDGREYRTQVQLPDGRQRGESIARSVLIAPGTAVE